MAREIPEKLLIRLSELIASHIGLYFPKNRWNDLVRNMEMVSKEMGFNDLESGIHALLSSPLTHREIHLLTKNLTIGETFFFRDNCVFQAVKDIILPELIYERNNTGKRINLWSAGCCTGEEPYSIAMLIDQMLPGWEGWHIRLLATDLNEVFLKKAGQGTYTSWSFRNAPAWIKQQYFKATGDNSFELLPRIKRMVTFSQLNLALKSYSSVLGGIDTLDVIFCRNVLMYFAQELRTEIIERFCRLLGESGWLILSPSEVPLINHPALSPVQFPGTILFRKKVPGQGSTTSDQAIQGSRIDRGFSISPIAIARKTASDHSMKAELKNAITSEVSDFIQKEKKNKEGAAEDELQVQQNLIHEALTLYAEGLYDKAAQKLNEIVSRYHSIGDCMSLKPGSMALLARAYANQGKLEEAKKWCVEAINAEKLLPGHYYLYATICQEQGMMDESISSLEKALYLDQDFVLAHFALGNITQRQGKVEESRRHFKNALTLLQSMNPEDVLPYSEGIQARRLLDVVQSMMKEERSE
ncbi:MAG: CheR family methyltransferase [bacterium]